MEKYKNSEGELCKKPFWSLPRRCPHTTQFDPTNQEHLDFIEAFGMLHAKFWGCSAPDGNQPRDVTRRYIAEVASTVELLDTHTASDPPMNEEEAKKYQDGVSAADHQKAAQDFDPTQFDELAERVCERLEEARVAGLGLTLFEDEFEKDDDANFHIAFITAASNLRATGYGIAPESFFRTKLVAGKIIPGTHYPLLAIHY